MTIKELIDKLKEYSENYDVYVADEGITIFDENHEFVGYINEDGF